MSTQGVEGRDFWAQEEDGMLSIKMEYAMLSIKLHVLYEYTFLSVS